MRILQLHAGGRTPANQDAVVRAEAAALRNAGHDVFQVIEPTPRGTVAAFRALATSRYNRSTGAAVADACREWKPEIVHVHDTYALSSSVIDAAAEADIPIVMTIHDYRLGCLGLDLFRGDELCTACVGRSPLSGVVHGCYQDSRALSAIAAIEISSTGRRCTLDRVSRFVAPSAFMADRLIDIGVPDDRLTVNAHFSADPGERTAAPAASNEILFVGRLDAARGVRTLLRAWERYVDRADSANALLTIIGDGPLAHEARETAPRGVTFEGRLSHDEVRARMLTARALVFPSEWYEPFGMVLIEAMAAGLPIIATTVSDAARITATPMQLIAPAGDARALAACLEHLDDHTVDEAGRAARSRYLAAYTEAAGVAGLEALYDSVTGVRPTART